MLHSEAIVSKSKPQKKFTWHMIELEGNVYDLAFCAKKLIYVGSPNAAFAEIESWMKRYLPANITRTEWNQLFSMEMNDVLVQETEQQLRAYLKRELRDFTISFDMYGTAFQKEVWNMLKTIPYGQTWSYQQVADQLGKPSSVRAVANAIGANPLMFLIPCHRVIAKNGDIGGFRGGIALKQRLLEVEKGVN